MASMQPTKSHKYLVSGAGAANAFVALRNRFDLSEHWEVQFQTSDTGFVVRQLLGDTTSQYLFVRSSNNVTMRIDPNGTISDGSGTGISAMASPSTNTIAFNTAYWQFHEWSDAFTIFTCDYSSSIVDYPLGIHAGYIHTPAFSTDPAVGLTGQGFLSGAPAVGLNGATNWISLTTANGSRVRVANTGVEAADWLSITSSLSYFLDSTTNSNIVFGRDQPEPIVAVTGGSQFRRFGFWKYIFSRAPSQTPGVCQFVGGVRKMQHFGTVHSTSSPFVMGVEDDFQPAGAPT